MDDLILKKSALFNTLESITFVWFVLLVTVLVALYGFNKLSRLNAENLFQIKMFNINIFFRDRRLFGDQAEKPELERKDLIEIYKDQKFRAHLLAKEPQYFIELARIVENIKQLNFYILTVALVLLSLAAFIFYVWKTEFQSQTNSSTLKEAANHAKL